MKKVIFVCLLSLSMCLSQQSQPIDTATKSPPAGTAPNATGTETKAADAKPDHPLPAAAETPAQAPAVAAGTQNATATNTTLPVPVSNETSTKTDTTKPAEKNSTEVKPNADSAATVKRVVVDPSKEKNETKPAVPVPANNATNADSKDGKKNDTTTPKGENVSPTVAPVEAKSRAFDGPSFICGIIVTLDLLAIGFFGFKCYKDLTEINYIRGFVTNSMDQASSTVL